MEKLKSVFNWFWVLMEVINKQIIDYRDPLSMLGIPYLRMVI